VGQQTPSSAAKAGATRPLGWKKAALFAAIVLGAIVLPVVLLSTASMERYQQRIDRDPQTPFNRWLQMATADLCLRTFRPGLAAEYYRKFWERYPTDLRRPIAWLGYARSLEECDRSADALSAYQKYLSDYPDREDRREAAAGIERIKFIRH